MMHQPPVRPHPETPSVPGGEGGKAQSPSVVGSEDEDVNFAHVLEGQEKQHESDAGFREPVPLKSPRAMTPLEKAKRDLTHIPPHPGCTICTSTRTPNLAHTATHEHLRIMPLLVGDYCLLKGFGETTLATCLVLRLYPFKNVLACIVPKKGMHTLVIFRVTRIIKEISLVHFAYRCDREASLNSLIEEAIAKAGRTGKRVYKDDPENESDYPIAIPDDDEDSLQTLSGIGSSQQPTLVAVPELAHPGESTMAVPNAVFEALKSRPGHSWQPPKRE